MLPTIGSPLGPGGYGGRLEAHFFRVRARTIAVMATAKAGPAHFSRIDMTAVDGEEEKSESLVRVAKERSSKGNGAALANSPPSQRRAARG